MLLLYSKNGQRQKLYPWSIYWQTNSLKITSSSSSQLLDLAIDTITIRPPNSLSSAFKWLLVYAQIKGSDNANCLLQALVYYKLPKLFSISRLLKLMTTILLTCIKLIKLLGFLQALLWIIIIVYSRYIWMLIKRTLITLSHTQHFIAKSLQKQVC